MPYTQMDGMGARMPEWTAYDLHELSMHAVALAKLATEVNTRAREAFGGNFPELVWVSDCYEYNPANAQKDMAPIHANQQELRQAVLVLSQVLADGLASSSTPVVAAPSPAPSPVLPVGELDDLASADDGLSSSTRRRGGKKSKKKSERVSTVRLEAGEGNETPVAAEQTEQLLALAQMASMVPANSDVSRSTVEELD